MTFGELVRRTRGDLSQEEAADRAGVNPRTWGRWEQGGLPQRTKARRFAEAFGLDTSMVAQAIDRSKEVDADGPS